MKNIIIKACAVLLALLVVLTAILGTFSPDLINYYDTYGKMILEHPFKTILYDRPIWEYYSKTSNGHTSDPSHIMYPIANSQNINVQSFSSQEIDNLLLLYRRFT